MNYADLVSFLVKSLVKDGTSVSVKQFDTSEDEIHIEVLVSNDEIGSVIGKGGIIANAIRTIVQASSYAHNDKKVRIHIDSI